MLTDGLWLSLIGMGVVFAVLSLLALSIRAFERIDSLIPEGGSTVDTEAQTAEPAPVASGEAALPGSDDATTAAAIAVALALAETGGDASSTMTLPSGSRAASATNTWVAAGRGREMANRLARQSQGNRNR